MKNFQNLEMLLKLTWKGKYQCSNLSSSLINDN